MFQLDITGGSAPESFNIDMKNGKGAIGPGKSTKPDATITMTDANFVELAEGCFGKVSIFADVAIDVLTRRRLSWAAK